MARFPEEFDSCVQIIGPDGAYDTAAVDALDLESDDLVEIYRSMVTARALEQRGLTLQRQGRLHFWMEARGLEASHVGSAAALDAEDWLQTEWRQYGAHIHRGRSLEDILLFWLRGYEEWESDDPDEAPAHERRLPYIVAVGTQVPQAVGLMWGRKLQGKSEAGLVGFGDGGASKGDVHAGMIFAGVFEIPIVFLLLNNQWAISVPVERQLAAESYTERAPGYGFDGILVDGDDPLAVYQATREAIQRAKHDNEPTLVEALTYRRAAHSSSDDPSRYRDEAEVEAWEARDPIDRFETFLEDRGLWTEAEGERIRAEADDRVKTAAESAIEIAEEQTPREAFDEVFANPPDFIDEQWREFQSYYDRHGDEGFGW
jgi:pyruvate dehydrogenase E1 component alpha subunit